MRTPLFHGNAEAPFKILSCGSRFNPAGSLDSWATFPEAYNRLIEVIDEEEIEGVVMLTGDIHRSAFTILPGLAYDIPEIVSRRPLLVPSGSASSRSLIASRRSARPTMAGGTSGTSAGTSAGTWG